MTSKADSFLYSALLEHALAHSDNPGMLGQVLTGQIREIVGGKTVILYYCDSATQKVRVVGASPERRSGFGASDEILELVRQCGSRHQVELLSQQDSPPEISRILSGLEVDKSIYVPLIINDEQIGAILIHDLFSDSGIDTVLTTLNQLSGIFALTLKNAMAYIQLEEVTAAKEKVFSIIAHDLRGPFMTMGGFVDLLADAVKKGDYAKLENYAGILSKTVSGTYTLLENLLEWSAFQTDRLQYRPGQIVLASLIDEATGLLMGQAQRKNLRIKKAVPPEIEAYGDRRMIATVLRNLVSNAIKYTQRDGVITITAERQQDAVHVAVADTGIGMSPEQAAQLFSLGQARSTLGTDDEKGTGLGLSLCRELIDRHKGRLWVESEVGGGSSFHFTLPHQ